VPTLNIDLAPWLLTVTMTDQPPTEIVAEPSEQARETSLDSPVPLSFPAILRNPGVASRYAHLQESTIKANAPVQRSKKSKVNDNEGKRWVRRKENGWCLGLTGSQLDLTLLQPSSSGIHISSLQLRRTLSCPL